MADNTVTIHIDAKTDDAKKGIDGVNTSLGQIGSNSGTGMANIAAGFYLIQQAASAAIGIVSSFTNAFMESEDAVAKLQQTLNTTGNVLGTTAGDLAEFASKLSKATGLSDESIMGMQTILLTFKNIGADSFQRVTEAVVDLAAQFGGDLQSNAIKLGKAMNDPIMGMTALSKMGVTFSESQKKMVKEMIESGDLLGAQNLILVEVEGQVKGVAEAMGNTASGSIRKFKNAIGELQETIGGVVVKGLKPMLDAVLQFATSDEAAAAAERIGAAMISMKDAVAQAAKPFLDVLLPAIKKVVDFIKDDFAGLNREFTIAEVVRMKIVPAFEDMYEIIKNVLNLLKPLADFEMAHLQGQIEAIRGAFEVAGTAIKNVTGFLREHETIVAAVVAAYVAYKLAMIGGAIYTAVAAGIGIMTVAMTTGLIPALIAMAANEGILTAAQVALNIAMSANPIGLIAIAIAALVAVGVLLYLNFDKITAAAGYLWDRIKEAGSGISEAWNAMVGFVTDKATALWNDMKEIATGIYDAVVGSFRSMVDSVTNKATALWNDMKQIATGIYDAVVGAFTSMVDSVTNKATELWDTIKGVGTGIYDAVVGAFTSMIDFVKTYWPEIISLILLPFFPIVAFATDAFGIRTALGKAWDWIANKTKEFINSIIEFFQYLYGHSYLVSDTVDAIVNYFTMMRDLVLAIWQFVVGSIEAAWKFIYDASIAGVTTVVDFVVARFRDFERAMAAIYYAVTDVIKDAWKSIYDVSSAIVTAVVDYVVAYWDMLKATTTAVWDAITGAIKDAWKFIYDVSSAIVTTVVDFLVSRWENLKANTAAIWDAITGALKDAWDYIYDIVSSVAQKVVDFLSGVWDAVTAAVSNCWELVKQIVGDAMSAVWDYVRDRLNDVVDRFKSLGGMILSALGNVGSLLYGAGRSIVMGLWNGIMSMWESVVNVLRRLKDAAIAAALGAVGWHGDESPPSPGGSETPPGMASGGVVKATPGGILARLGEGGQDEAVIPLGRGAGSLGSTTINNYSITLSGVITDPVATGQAVADALNRASIITGPLVLSSAVRT